MKRLKILLLIVLLSCGFLAAQTPTGKIIGKVTDVEGIPLPGVSVSAESPKLLGGAAAITDATGTFRMFALPSGTYTLTYELAGFNSLKRTDIFLQLEQTITINIKMQVASLEEEVTVIGMSPIIDVKSTVKGKTMEATPQKAQAYTEEGRMMVLRLMGYLVSFYRKYSMGTWKRIPVTEKQNSEGGPA